MRVSWGGCILYNTVVADVVLVIMDEMVVERMLAGIILRTKFRWAVRSLSCGPRRSDDAISNLHIFLYFFHWKQERDTLRARRHRIRRCAIATDRFRARRFAVSFYLRRPVLDDYYFSDKYISAATHSDPFLVSSRICAPDARRTHGLFRKQNKLCSKGSARAVFCIPRLAYKLL